MASQYPSINDREFDLLKKIAANTATITDQEAGDVAQLIAGTGISLSPAGGTGVVTITSTGGNVVGPAASTDNAITRFDGITGKLVQNSVITIADTTGAMAGWTTGAGLTFHGGGTITGASGAVTVTPSGTNASVVLNTGANNGWIDIGVGSFWTTPTAGHGLLYGDTTNGLVIGGRGTSFDLYFANRAGGAAIVVPANTQKVLLGGLATDGTGVLQLPAATTSAGGIAHGTDLNTHRLSAGVLAVDNVGGAAPRIELRSSGVNKGGFEVAGDSVYLSSRTAGGELILRSGNSATALTLTSGQDVKAEKGIVSLAALNAHPNHAAAVIDTDGTGVFRAYSYGPDASTNGSWSWLTRRSDGSNSSTPMTLTSAGGLDTTGFVRSGQIIVGTASDVRFFGGGAGVLSILDQATTAGVTLNIATDDTWKFRKRSNPAQDAAITAGAITSSTLLTLSSTSGTSAGGILFGADTALYRNTGNSLSMTAGGQFFTRYLQGVATSGYIDLVAGSNSIGFYPGSALSLTLSGSDQSATFAGNVSVATGKTLTTAYNNIGTTSTTSINLANTQAASAGAQQRSPNLLWTGRGWSTDAGGASMPVNFFIDVLPVQGAAAPTSTINFGSIINGVTTTPMTLTSTGALTVGSTMYATGRIETGNVMRVPAAGQYQFDTRSIVASSADGLAQLTNSGNTAGVTLDFSTDSTAKFRNRANNADAAITALSCVCSTFGSAFGVATSASTFGNFGASTTAVSSIRLAHGTAPSAPVDGDVWTTTAGLFVRVNGVTVGPLS